jgi:NitT/TauT family transport system ATP-binding protein
MQISPTQQRSAGTTVDLHGISRIFPGPVSAVDPLDLHISAGQFLAMIGPSGCGKSTLLRIIAGLDKPTTGSIQAGPSGPGHRAKIAYVFQDAHLLPWRNVLRNVALPLELMGVPKSQRIESAIAAIEQVGLADAIRRYPTQLSGGMRMRVSLARALVTNPDLLLLDEPFASLDEITRQQLDEQLHELWRSRGMTVIFVTHSIIEAAFLAQRAIVFTRRPARIVLDHRLDLPVMRTMQLRGEAGFAEQTRILLEALVRGGEM